MTLDVKSNKELILKYLQEMDWVPQSVAVDSRNESMRDQIDGPDLVLDEGVVKLYCNSYEGVYTLTLNQSGKALTSPRIVLRAQGYHAPSDVNVIKVVDTWRMYFGIHTEGIFTAKVIK